MVTIRAPESCGNAPRKQFLKDFNTAFAQGDVDTILEGVTEDIHWITFGEINVRGRDEFADALRTLCENGDGGAEDEWIIKTIITHGNTASCDGEIQFGSGDAYAFCDVYEFDGYDKNARIQEMRSYAIELEGGNET